jgi:hypothetical protein
LHNISGINEFNKNVFNEEDIRKLNYYAARNEGLAAWDRISFFQVQGSLAQGIGGSANDWTR